VSGAGGGELIPGAPVGSYERVLQRDLVHGSLWTLMSSLVLVPLTCAVSLVLAHVLHPAGLGRLATYIAVFAVATTVANLGVSDATVQWLAEARALGETDRERGLIRRCAGYHSYVEGPVVAVVALVLLHHAGWPAAIVGAVAVWLTQILGTSTVILTATARNAAAAKLALVTAMAVQVAVVSSAVAAHSPSLTYVCQLSVTCLGPVLCLLALSGAERSAVLHPVLSTANPPGFRRYGLSACAGALVSGLVFGRSELFVLQAHHRLLAAGLFTVATGLASQITIPMDALMGPLVPTAAGVVAVAPERALPALQRALRVSSLLGALTAAVAVPAVYVLIPFAFGSDYTAARNGFLALGLASCLQSVVVPVSAFAFATRSAAAVLRADLVCLVVDALLALTLIPVVGLTGAVVASASAQVLSLLLLVRVVVRRMRIGTADIAGPARSFLWGPVGGVLAVTVARASDLRAAPAVVLAVAVGLASTAVVFRLGPMRLDVEEMTRLDDNLPVPVRRLFRWLCLFLGARIGVVQ
jgi:O-antigen/teichoic acid export membrane protein